MAARQGNTQPPDSSLTTSYANRVCAFGLSRTVGIPRRAASLECSESAERPDMNYVYLPYHVTNTSRHYIVVQRASANPSDRLVWNANLSSRESRSDIDILGKRLVQDTRNTWTLPPALVTQRPGTMPSCISDQRRSYVESCTIRVSGYELLSHCLQQLPRTPPALSPTAFGVLPFTPCLFQAACPANNHDA